MQRIVLDRMVVDCVVGILEEEQRRLQPLELDVAMDVDLVEAGETGDLSSSVDYAAVCDQVAAIAQHGRFRLLESLALAVCRLLLLRPAGEARAPIHAVEVRIRKPEALGGRAHPNVLLGLRRGEVPTEVREPAEGVVVEVLVETPLSLAWRVQLASGAVWAPPRGAVCAVVAGEVTVGQRALVSGQRAARGEGDVAASRASVLLVVGQP